jgi:hypothetical protein
MVAERDAPRDFHRLFGLLLTDFFTRSPFLVDVERDVSQQQQFLDVVIVRRGRGRFADRLPDGLDGLAEHNLITFKSHHETLDSWAMKELIGYYVAYRKLVSPSPSQLLAEERFRLYAVCARFPHNLSGQVPWYERQPGVYDCLWGTDTIRVIVAGQLSREMHIAPLLLFSPSWEQVRFAQGVYRPRSEYTSLILGQLVERFQWEGLAMSYTMEDFKRDYIVEHFPELPPDKQREVLERIPSELRRELLQSLSAEQRRELLQSLPLEERLAGLSPEQIQQYLEQLTAGRPTRSREPRRKR